jgi:hypothetical protein
MAIHTHPGSAPHDHEGDVAGHTHDDTAVAPAAVAPTPTAVTSGPPAGGTAARMALTILGAAALIIGAFLSWAFGDAGTRVGYSVFYDPSNVTETGLVSSAGGVFIILGLLALLGLAFETGWLTRLAGALALIGWVLVLITLFRLGGLGSPESGFGAMEIGLWVILLGSILILVAGFLGARRVTTTTAY